MSPESKSCQEYIEQLRREYIAGHIREQERNELVRENNIEKRDVKGYHGREILELLQNADDAYQKSIELGQKPDTELNVKISYIKDQETNLHILSVSNTGTFFDEVGIKAIVEGNDSPKKGTYIGNKGTGFRAVLNWASEVQIHSGDWHVQFSHSIAKTHFQKVQNEPQIVKQLQVEPNLHFSILALPEFMENEKRYDETIIRVIIDPTKQNDEFSVEKQINGIDLRTLLFLPNVAQIQITTDEGFICYKRVRLPSSNIVELWKVDESGKEQHESYYLFSEKKKGIIEEDGVSKDMLLSIAVPVDFDKFTASNLYTFFPLLDAPSPFNCVMHASYDLGDHRNSVSRSITNRRIMKEQIRYLFDVVEELIKMGKWDIAYQLLIPLNFLDNKNKLRNPFGEQETAYYIECLKERKLFQTVAGNLLSVNDGIKFIYGYYPPQFCGEAFSNLIVPIRVPGIYNLIKAVSDNIDYSENDLCDRINISSAEWDCNTRVSVFSWWNCIYKATHCLPNLLRKQNGTWVQYKESCFFIVGKSQDIPRWANISALSEACQRALFECTETAITQNILKALSNEKQTERLISQEGFYKHTVTFQYYDISTIIPQLSKSVNSYDDAIQFVKWLWRTHGNKGDWDPKPSKIEYRFPAWNPKTVTASRELYWGNSYDNTLGKNLFRNGEKEFPPISEFEIEEELHEEFMKFLQKFSIRTYPAITIQRVAPQSATYIKMHKTRVEDYLSETIHSVRFDIPYICGLDEILSELSTTELLQWIGGDTALENCLRSPYATGGKILYLYGQKYKDREYADKIQNYIPVVFNEAKWVEIGDKRYAPREVLQNIWTNKNQQFEGLLPIISESNLEAWCEGTNLSHERIIEILKLFHFANDVTELSSQNFYGLMLRIPTLQNQIRSREISKAIHRLVERPDFKKEFDKSPNKTQFFAEGKMLVKHQNELIYFPAKDSYLPSPKIVNKKNTPIVEKGMRTNSSNFVKVFNCREAEHECIVCKETMVLSPCDSTFQEEFREFKKFARAYWDNNGNIAKIGDSLKVTLLQHVEVFDGENQVPVGEEYTLVRDSGSNWYITVFSSTYDSNFISENIETIYSNIADTSGFDAGRFGELFRVKGRKDREFLIKKDFGDLSVLEIYQQENLFRNMFIETIKKLDDSYCTDGISEDLNWSSLSEIRHILMDVNSDIDSFKKAGFPYKIDLTDLYKKEAHEISADRNDVFMDFLYHKAKSTVNGASQFLGWLDELKTFYSKINYKNSVHFQVVEAFVKEFGDWRKGNFPSAKDQYHKNYTAMNPNDLFRDQISVDRQVQNMIYFAMEDQFRAWLESEEQKQKDSSTATNVDPYAKYKSIIPTECELEFTQESVGTDHGAKSNGRSESYTQSAHERKQRRQKELGNKGELLVYNKLCKRYGSENVKMRSEAFVEMKMLPPGLASSSDYDLSYTDHEGNEHFVEVKTGELGTFFLSRGELEFAKKHSDNYEVHLVYHMDKEIPDTSVLPCKFWENEKFRCEPVVEKYEVRF